MNSISDNDLFWMPRYLIDMYTYKTGRPVLDVIERRIRARNAGWLQLLAFLACSVSVVAFFLGGERKGGVAAWATALSAALTVTSGAVRRVNGLNESEIERLNRFKGFIVDVSHWLGREPREVTSIKHENRFWEAVGTRLADLSSRDRGSHGPTLSFFEGCAVTPYANDTGVWEKMRATRPSGGGVAIEM